MSKNRNLDKFYTPKETAKECIDIMLSTLKDKIDITEFIEPSAGSGNFSDEIENCIAYDILPDSNNIIQADFLKLDLFLVIHLLVIAII